MKFLLSLVSQVLSISVEHQSVWPCWLFFYLLGKSAQNILSALLFVLSLTLWLYQVHLGAFQHVKIMQPDFQKYLLAKR